MPRHSLRRNGRRLALALSLMLVAGAVAIPALAGPPKDFSVAVDADLDGTFTVTFTNDSRNTDLGAARITVPDDLEVEDLSSPPGSTATESGGVIEVTDLAIAPRSEAAITFGVAACGETYAFTDPQAKQANDFSGEPGNDLDYQGEDPITVTTPDCPDDDPLFEFGEDEQVDCSDPRDDELCTIDAFGSDDSEDQKITASINAREGRIGLRTVGEDDIGEAVAEAVRAGCEDRIDELDEPARLGDAVIHLLPVDFDNGGELEVRNLIPRSQVNTDENRSAHIFQVCFAPEKGDPDDEITVSLDGEDVGTGLYGPILLPDCADDVAAPCVVDRQKVKADVVITYRIPAEDPWLM